MRHVEGLEVFVASALACIDQIRDAFLLKLVVVDATVLSKELFDCAIATANPDDDRLSLNLHKDLLASKTVDTGRFPLELHLAAQAKRRFVDVFG